MNRLSSFNEFALTSDEMQGVKGGSCHIWSISSQGTYTVAPTNMSKKQAKKTAAKFVQDYGAGYGWCCGSSC